jgi:hypothetical protein
LTGAEVQATYFSPMMYFLYLFVIFALMVTYYQWQWSRKCNTQVRVLVVKPDGSTDTEYAPKSGGYVALKTIDSNTTRLWPINKLSAIEMLYPGDGFIPAFLQKKIKTVIVDDEDWEPLLNRGSYTERVSSPDVVRVIRELANLHPKAAQDLTDLADSLSTAPTRDMVASPSVLGNIMKEKVSEMAITISKDTFDKMEGISRKLANIPNATVVYIGLGLVVILIAVLLFKILPGLDNLDNLGDMSQNIQMIKDSLGIKALPVPIPR